MALSPRTARPNGLLPPPRPKTGLAAMDPAQQMQAAVPRVANGQPQGLSFTTGGGSQGGMQGGSPDRYGERGTPMQRYLRGDQTGPMPGGGAPTGGGVPVPESAPRTRPGGLLAGRYRDAPVQREAAAGVGTGREIEGVSGRLSGLLGSDSPYIEQARRRAQRAANARGLMSSSIAAGAGEEAAIGAALPIATADAELSARERQMRSQEYQQARQHRIEQLMQQRGLDHTSAENQADRELQREMQRRGIASTEGMHARGIESQERMQGRDISSRELMQQRDHRVQQLMQERGLSHDAAQQQATRELQDLMQRRGITSAETMQQRDISSRELMQQRDHRVQQLMQERGLSHDAAQQQATRELQDLMQRRGITSAETMQQRDITSREGMQQRGFEFQGRENQLNRDLSELMQEKDHRVRQLMQERGLNHDAAQRLADREFQGRENQLNRQLSELMQTRDISSREEMQQRGLTHDATQAELDREAARLAQERGISHAEAMAEVQREHQSKIALQQITAQVNSDRLRWTSALALNTEIPAEERTRIEGIIHDTADGTLTAVSGLSGYEPVWSDA